ncbi:hypothetical protein VPNG_04650 [Cytospora leucostoma]|uniref:Uncharacterized protein n=1 Tax=Cytospora leucostoma TaxID=1230097 RepID=A0A423XAL2_9PEZI|nr:hypothetical protein VPNG_04650 [Cytospora leucostoma]
MAGHLQEVTASSLGSVEYRTPPSTLRRDEDVSARADSPDPYAPRSGPSSYPYDQPEYEQYQHYPVSSDEYTYQSPSAGHGFASTSTPGDGYGGYSNAYQTATGSSSSGDAFWSNTGSSMNSPISPSSSFSYGRASSVSSHGSSSGYAPTVSTAASSVPSRHDPMSVNHRIAQQQPTRNRCELPCEFLCLTGCVETFQAGDEIAWMDHIEGHLKGRIPTKLKCWFCDTWIFDANNRLSNGDVLDNFHTRMHHIRDHIVEDGYQASHMRPDGGVIRHLRHIISSQEYEDIVDRLNPTTVPPVPGGRHVGRIEEVEEEPYSTHRDKKKDRHESSRKKGSRK